MDFTSQEGISEVFPGALLSPLIEMGRLSPHLSCERDDGYAKLFRMRQGRRKRISGTDIISKSATGVRTGKPTQKLPLKKYAYKWKSSLVIHPGLFPC